MNSQERSRLPTRVDDGDRAGRPGELVLVAGEALARGLRRPSRRARWSWPRRGGRPGWASASGRGTGARSRSGRPRGLLDRDGRAAGPMTSLNAPISTPSSSKRNRLAIGEVAAEGYLVRHCSRTACQARSFRETTARTMRTRSMCSRSSSSSSGQCRWYARKAISCHERLGGVTHHRRHRQLVGAAISSIARDPGVSSGEVRRTRSPTPRQRAAASDLRVPTRRRPGPAAAAAGTAELTRSDALGVDECVVLLLAAEVDHPVEVLQERQVGREQALDVVRGDQLERAERLHHPREHQDRQPRVVRAADRRVAQRLELVAGRRQPHHARLVQPTVPVHVATRQRELVRGTSRLT